MALHNFLKKEEQVMDDNTRAYCPEAFGDDSTETLTGEWRNEPALAKETQLQPKKEFRNKLEINCLCTF